MKNCPSCGGVIGRDCFNPMDCARISMNEDGRQQQDISQLMGTVSLLEYRLQLLVEFLKRGGIDATPILTAEFPKPPPPIQPIPNPYPIPDDGLPF